MRVNSSFRVLFTAFELRPAAIAQGSSLSTTHRASAWRR
jgi:hypothetical protein